MSNATRILRNKSVSKLNQVSKLSLIYKATIIAMAASSLGMPFLTHAVSSFPPGNVITFGDSLSDSGFNQGKRFTTNPDQVWVQNLVNGLKVDPVSVMQADGTIKLNANGTNRAIGGARISKANPIMSTATSVVDQINQYLAAKPELENKPLYTIWAGANDVLLYTQDNANDLMNPSKSADAQQKINSNLSSEATKLVASIKKLQDAKAKDRTDTYTIAIFNLPNLAAAPSGPGDKSASLTLSTKSFNDALAKGLDSLDKNNSNIVALDAFSLFDEITKNPKLYGFTNMKDLACTSDSSIDCTSSSLKEPNANNKYLFADDMHPTGAGHKLLAQYVISTLQAPSQIAKLAEAPRLGGFAITNALEPRFSANLANSTINSNNNVASNASSDSARVWVGYERSNQKFQNKSPRNTNTKNFFDADSTVNTLLIGVDTIPKESVNIGVAVGFGKNKTNFTDKSGSFKMNQAMLALYTQYHPGPWSIDATVAFSTLSYKDITRNIALGSAIHSEMGNTKGRQTLARIGAQYDFTLTNDIVTGPVLSLAWQSVTVNGYKEKSTEKNTSTSMSFGNQKQSSWLSSIGWQITTASPIMSKISFQPFAQVAWEKQFKNKGNDLRANIIGMPSSFTTAVVPSDNRKLGYTRATVGAQVGFSNGWSGVISYTGRFPMSSSLSKNTIHAFEVGFKKDF